MDADRWQQITPLYHAARERPIEERRAFLDSAGGADEALRDEVESLLSGDARAEGFTAAPTDALAGVVQSNTETAGGIATPGAPLGNYRIERRLGRGGMGTVFLAYDTTLHRPVALKSGWRKRFTPTTRKSFTPGSSRRSKRCGITRGSRVCCGG